MRQTILFWVVLVFIYRPPVSAQYFITFDQASYDPLSEWHGDVHSFAVNSLKQLQLNANQGGESAIFYPFDALKEWQWQLDFKMDFAPSSKNKLIIYLWADDTTNIQNGYSLELGETGTKDALHLFKYQNGQKTKLASGQAQFGSSPIDITLTIKHEENKWTCFTRQKGENQAVPQFELKDTIAAVHGYFGLQCIYTNTRKDKYFFDNILLGIPPKDTTPPSIVSHSILDSQRLEIVFDEMIYLDSSLIERAIQIFPALAISSIQVVEKKLIISFRTPLVSGQKYKVQISNIRDTNANMILPIAFDIEYKAVRLAERYGLIVTEFMADSSPQISLPEAEYIEIWNRSNHFIQLEDYTLSDDGKQCPFPNHLMAPDEILILCHEKDSTSFSTYGKVLGLKCMPGLNNTADDIIILDYLGNVVEYISYNLEWYHSTSKSSGGWSIELQNLGKICEGPNAWSAAQNLRGGTPGQHPLSNSDISPSTSVKLDYILVEDPYEIQLHFNQSIRLTSFNLLEYIRISPSIITADFALDFTAPKIAYITLREALIPGKMYHINIDIPLHNCLNITNDNVIRDSFALAQSPDEGDLLINEILFNPLSHGADYVEIINRSSKVLDLSNLKIGNVNNRDTIIVFPGINMSIYPGQIMAFSSSPEAVRLQYKPPQTAQIIKSRLPPWNNDNGNVTLLQSVFERTKIIDQMDYDEGMHHPALTDPEGVSLERFDTATASSEVNNWNSAAALYNYGTPGYQNSNRKKNVQSSARIYLDQDYIDLNDPSNKLVINYRLDKPNYQIRIQIFNLEGRFIRSISSNEIQGNHGFFVWNGLDLNNNTVSTGIYIILATLLHRDGEIARVKIPFTVNRY